MANPVIQSTYTCITITRYDGNHKRDNNVVQAASLDRRRSDYLVVAVRPSTTSEQIGRHTLARCTDHPDRVIISLQGAQLSATTTTIMAITVLEYSSPGKPHCLP